MPTLFAGQVGVAYGQIYVESRHEDYFEYLTEARGGQVNGLCGAAVPGFLFLTTGLHTGIVDLTAEAYEEEPPIHDEWEEVVEVSFRPATEKAALVQWAGEASWPLALTLRDYRVRYCASGMDEARHGSRWDGDPPIDRYLLQFWPAPPGPDRVVRQTSGSAAYWHGVARQKPAPPTPERRAEAKRRVEEEQRRAREEASRRAEERRWGGRLPDERVRLIPLAHGLARLDRDLLDALAVSGPTTQRVVARWAARKAYTEAQIAHLDWVAPALAAAERGESLPPPFDDPTGVWQVLLADRRVPGRTVSSHDGRHHNLLQPAMAFPSLFSAVEADPLAAAVGALYHASIAFGLDHPRLFAAVRAAFPQLVSSARPGGEDHPG